MLLPNVLPIALAVSLASCVQRHVELGGRCPPGRASCVVEEDAATGASDSAIGHRDALMDAGCDGGCGARDAASPESVRCVPGYYVGEFYVPEYRPVAAGLCGLVTVYGGPGNGLWEFVIPPGAVDAGTMQVNTCLDFELKNQTDGGTMASDGGTDDGGLRPADGGIPGKLRAAMTATLNCETGALSGELEAAYYSVGLCDLGTTQAWYSVKGFIEATFDPNNRSFIDGVVDLREPASLLPVGGAPPGGKGTWHARLVTDASTTPPVVDCLAGEQFTDFEVQP